MKGHIYFISGVSGAGKGTLTDNIKKENIEKLMFPLSCKSRKPRPNEVPWVDANFLSVDDFKSGIENGDFLEYAVVYGLDYYGTRFVDVIENGIDKGFTVIKEVDLEGLEKVNQSKPELKKDYTTIFLDVDNETMKERIVSRDSTISENELESRLQTAYKEREMSEMCDHKIDATQTPEMVLSEVLKIIKG